MRWSLPLSAAVGCAGANALSPESFLDRQRILAVQVQAPDGRSEAVPGDVVTVSVLAWAPNGVPMVLVTTCIPSGEDDSGACPSADLLQNARSQSFETPEGQQWAVENGILGVLPGLPVGFPVSAEMLLEGVSRLYVPLGLGAWVDDPDEADERATVTLVLTDASSTPNHNPNAPQVRVDGQMYGDGATLQVAGGKVTRLTVVEPPEPEVWSDETGNHEETFTYRWYSDLGELSEVGFQVDVFEEAPRTEMDWDLPAATRDGELYLVVRDGRGGMAWTALTVEVR